MLKNEYMRIHNNLKTIIEDHHEIIDYIIRIEAYLVDSDSNFSEIDRAKRALFECEISSHIENDEKGRDSALMYFDNILIRSGMRRGKRMKLYEYAARGSNGRVYQYSLPIR